MALLTLSPITTPSLNKQPPSIRVLIRGFCHLYDGHEALAVGMEAAITRKDAVITSYRDHCMFLGRGGGARGRVLRAHGEAERGQLFEALNIAALWGLPAILVCENNHYGVGTATWRSAKSPAYFKRGDYMFLVDVMDALAVKQACKFAKEHGPIILEMDT
ncbi:Pyruvate dehydrogenase E1 component subunit alpha-2 [Raphanus sativus]|nr:Pyruvate dehydrogenase E1 component subunit alpha-2 [Raphanus sativus]